MRMAFFLAFALIFSMGMGLAEEQQAEDVGKPRAATVLYKVKADATDEAKAALGAVLKKHEFQGVRKLVKGQVEQARAGAAGLPSEEELCKQLVATGAVEFAEPDCLIAPVGTVPNDPDYSLQWHHPKINTPGAWDITKGSDSVTVAVLDTGVQANHPDLAANLLLPGKNTVDNSTNTSPVHPHGTMTSGCVGAVGDNYTGVSGVAWTIKILPVRISNRSDGSAYLSDMAEGIAWAADRGAKVANLSYGGANSATIDCAAQYLRGKGGLLFMAAGNDGVDQSSYPDFTSFVAVGATDAGDARASWSTYGKFVDVVAPGVDIYTTTWSGKTGRGSSYATVSGTSFASPITAGVAALIYAVKPGFSPVQVENFIFSTAKDLGDANVYGRGRVDAAAAVAAAKAAADAPDPGTNLPPVARIAAAPVSGTAPLAVALDGSASSDPDGTIAFWSWSFGDGSIGAGAKTTHTFSAAGSYTVRLVVIDNLGAATAATQVITVTGGGGKPPRGGK